MWLNIAAKLVPGMIKTGMSIAANRRKAKELESVSRNEPCTAYGRWSDRI